ncbi:hypothetical protein TNCV_2073531 [Trichonephila clavipes]|uniref:Uncharacterized protein n=1 Tax=Trichonephila clavipes TaxID=2585209 RepID=A0A8X6RAE3_TRICX|nr:hypothetical protein TNCV_2073531 [Trichonephila clavipes]
MPISKASRRMAIFSNPWDMYATTIMLPAEPGFVQENDFLPLLCPALSLGAPKSPLICWIIKGSQSKSHCADSPRCCKLRHTIQADSGALASVMGGSEDNVRREESVHGKQYVALYMGSQGRNLWFPHFRHGQLEMSMNRYTSSKLADIYFIYDLAKGNGRLLFGCMGKISNEVVTESSNVQTCFIRT